KASNGRMRPFAYITQEAMDKLKTPPPADLITQKAAAAILGYSLGGIWHLLRKGRLKYASGNRLSKAEVKKFAAAIKNNPPRAGYRWVENPEEKFPWRGKPSH